LPRHSRKDIVIIDNLSAQQPVGATTCRRTRLPAFRGDRGARRDVSLSAQIFARPKPIEMPFSKLKANLRKAAERTIRRICRFAATLTAREASNYFRHAGFARNPPESALLAVTNATHHPL
jgi:hypothetical protein